MKIVRYFFIGGTAAVVDIGLFSIFAYFLGYNYLIVAACTFILATLVNYFLSIRFVFSSGLRFSPRHEILMVFLVSGIGLVFNQVILFVAVEYFFLDKLLAKILATGLVFLWNYLSRSLYIFNSIKKDPC